ncbi:RNA-binding protein [Pilimelia terevasa]|uniref:RNA-binding protein n=1 Tax=Pilimelia terevasa TaxID=53372 RepID=A0A8J3BJF3_9ACTN|nr:NYN domain-containing protein [Pilimelia terevasa]GGK26521.1 RNA-binding protein [Pilimelia terevasa]
MAPSQPDETADRPEPAAAVDPVLPEPVRQRTVALVAAVLPQLAEADLPAPLRKVAKFAPARRAKLGGAAIATQLAADASFRDQAAALVRAEAGELAGAIREGSVPGAADPVEVAALAYLLRPAGWRAMVVAAGAAVAAETRSAEVAAAVREARQEVARAVHERAVARVEADKLRDELARVRDELGGLREEHRRAGRALRETEAARQRAAELLATEKGRLARAQADHEAELRRLRARLAEAQSAAGSARQAARDARTTNEARLWLLLETLGQTAVGLRRELGLEPAAELPADAVAAAHADRPPAAAAAAKARDGDDPARLDELLALPKVHLVVDGYNVTKRGYGELSLERQRQRLITGLSGLAAQTRAEVTVVFDGADKVPGLPPPPRGVRVLFSKKGEIADELIRRLVRAEPAGRPVVVVSSDREVADGIRRHGAYPAAADALLRRLGRA